MRRCDGRFMDGKTARQRPVQVELENARLRIVSLEDSEPAVLDSWSVASLRRVDEIEPKGTMRLKPNDTGNARLVIEDAAFIAVLMGMGPHLRRRSAAWRWVTGLFIAAIGIFASVLLVTGVPYFSSWVAPLVPVAWERDLGDKISGMLLGAFGDDARFCEAGAGRDVLATLSDRLTKTTDSVYDIRIRVSSHDMVNAVALPGGEIIVFNGLIAFAESPEELAGVIAHEIGHQVRRHPTQAMIRALGIDLVVDLVTGGAVLGSVGQSMMRLSYSRDAEREADEAGIAILAEAGIDSGGIARFFKRLDEKQGGLPEALAFLSTHPTSDSRAARANAYDSGDTRPALSPEAWQALREICS